MAIRLAASRQVSRSNELLAATAHAFARKLTQLCGDRTLHQCIVDTAAQMTTARLAGLSMYQPEEGRAGDGGHLRLPLGIGRPCPDRARAPGSSVACSPRKNPAGAGHGPACPGSHREAAGIRPARSWPVPIIANDAALGVVTLADREDGRPFTRGNLAAVRVISTLSSLALVREQLTRRSDELARAAAIDPLTGMFNRRYLYTRLNSELERSRRTGVLPALMMLDIDLFKHINDTLGHQAGDTVLRKVAEILRRSVRVSDVGTRYGGDEFCVIVPENASTARRRRLNASASGSSRSGGIPWASPQALQVTVSVGVCVAEPGESTEALVGRADQSLYDAKARGRNCVSA